jgi:hypothetical protein
LFGVVRDANLLFAGPGQPITQGSMKISSNWESCIHALNTFSNRFSKTWNLVNVQRNPMVFGNGWHLTIGGVTKRFSGTPNCLDIARVLACQIHHYKFKEAQEARRNEAIAKDEIPF